MKAQALRRLQAIEKRIPETLDFSTFTDEELLNFRELLVKAGDDFGGLSKAENHTLEGFFKRCGAATNPRGAQAAPSLKGRNRDGLR